MNNEVYDWKADSVEPDRSDITGYIARQQKQMTANMLMEHFVERGLELLAQDDIDGVREILLHTQQRMKYYGIDIPKFVTTGKV